MILKFESLLEGSNSTDNEKDITDEDDSTKEAVLRERILRLIDSDRLDEYHDVDWGVDDDQMPGSTRHFGGHTASCENYSRRRRRI